MEVSGEVELCPRAFNDLLQASIRHRLEEAASLNSPGVLLVKREGLKRSCSIRDGVEVRKSTSLHGRKHRARCGIVMVAECASLLMAGDAWPQGSGTSEHAIQAAFLFHFAQLAECPANAFRDAAALLTFCTVGEDEFRGALDESVSGKTIGNRPLRVQHLKQLEGADSCQVIFVNSEDKKRIPALLANLQNAPVLTVGDTESSRRTAG